MAKKPVKNKKTPPIKFEPQYVVLYTEGEPTFKLILKTQDEFDVFMGERKDEIDSEKIQLVTEDEFNKIEITVIGVDPGLEGGDHTLILDKTPEVEFDETNLPPQLVVESKKSDQKFTVNRKYFLANRSDLKLV